MTMYEVHYHYPRSYHAFVDGKCVHCAHEIPRPPSDTEPSPSVAQHPPCTAREPRMIVDGRTYDEARSYIAECAGPSEAEHWEIVAEKPVQLWAGVALHHQGIAQSGHASLEAGTARMAREAGTPLIICAGDRPVYRVANREADVFLTALRQSVPAENWSVRDHVPAPRATEHVRADLVELARSGEYSLHPGTLVGRFDTLGEAKAHPQYTASSILVCEGSVIS
jgi:hypothetical protein